MVLTCAVCMQGGVYVWQNSHEGSTPTPSIVPQVATPPPQLENAPRLGFVHYDFQQPISEGSLSMYQLAMAFGNKGYQGNLVSSINEIPGSMRMFDVIITQGVRHADKHWC